MESANDEYGLQVSTDLKNMIRALFICTQNRLRSPTAEQVFSIWDNIETGAAGLGNGANVPLSTEQLEGAAAIFVMEDVRQNKLNRNFKRHLNGKRVVCVNFADDFEFMQPALINLLGKKVGWLTQHRRCDICARITTPFPLYNSFYTPIIIRAPSIDIFTPKSTNCPPPS